MAEIKRPNYFNYQFLVEKDFDDEQGYHVGMRRRHNELMHTWGVADGLVVSRASADQVQISKGAAIDKDGREIVLEEARTYDLTTTAANTDVYLSIAYREAFDPADRSTQSGVDDFTRVTERPLLQDAANAPPFDGSVIVLAVIRLNASGAIESPGSINNDVRRLVSARVAPGAVGTDHLAGSAVTTVKLADSAVNAAKIESGSVGTAKLADLAVTGAKLADNAVTAAKIADGSVGTSELANLSVTNAKIASNSVDGAKIIDGSVGTDEIANGSVTNSKLADNSVNAAKIIDGSVGTAELADAAVTLSKVAAGSVDAVRIVDGSVGTSKLTDGAVTSAKLAAGNVGTSQLADSAVTSAKIADGSVNTAELANAAVTAAKIAAGAVDGTKIGDAAIGEAKLDAGTRAKLNGALSTNGGTVEGSTQFYPYRKSTLPAPPPGQEGHVGIGWYGGNDASGNRKELVLGVWAPPNPPGVIFDGIFVYHYGGNTNYGLRINSGKAYFGGGKEGFVTDRFVNASGAVLRAGDVVKLKRSGSVRFHGDMNSIPICEVTLADEDDDPLVIGIVDTEALPLFASPDTRADPADPFSIPDGGELMVVTLGAYARCKVDATTAPIRVGDQLTTSSKPGHARRAKELRLGSIIGKALEPLESGTGYIAVFVNIQ
jgi:hypothetical protein